MKQTTGRKPRAAKGELNGNGVHDEPRAGEPGSAGTPVEAATPTTEQIRLRAYQIYMNRRGVGGTAESDWLQAERELRAEAPRSGSASSSQPAGAADEPPANGGAAPAKTGKPGAGRAPTRKRTV